MDATGDGYRTVLYTFYIALTSQPGIVLASIEMYNLLLRRLV